MTMLEMIIVGLFVAPLIIMMWVSVAACLYLGYKEIKNAYRDD